jgi:predicted porin
MFNLGDFSMKKTLVAMAALASVSVFAQSSVTISGRLDLGHANLKTTTKVAGVNSVAKTFSLAGDQQGRTTSRLTFAGSEDLGGGLRANFNYETRLNPDTTAAPGLDRTRNMFINLAGGFGSVTIGTYLNPLDAVRGYSVATYSAPGGDFLANHIGLLSNTTLFPDADIDAAFGTTTAAGRTAVRAALSNGLSGRSTNSIGYRTPNMGGFTGSIGVSQEKTSTDNTSLAKTNGFILSAAYANGPLNALLAFGQGKGDSKSTATNLTSGKTTDVGFGVSYDLGVAVPYIQFERTKAQINNLLGAAVDGDFTTRATEIGAKFPLGAFTPYVTFGGGKIGDDVKTSAFQIGTTYDISKRTYLYAATGNFKIKEDGSNSIKTTGYKLGLVHSF